MSELILIIGNKNYSSWSLRPWIFMKHFQLEFTEKWMALFTETTDAQLASYFSNDKVPILMDDSLQVWDTLAILEYLSENYLTGQGWPAEKNARAFARSVSAEMHSSFTDLRNELPMNCRQKFCNFKLSASVQNDIQRIKDIWQKCKTEYGSGGDWLFGEYSIADAMFAPVVLRFDGYDVPLNAMEKAYVECVIQHPNMQQWIVAGKQEKEIIEMNEVTV